MDKYYQIITEKWPLIDFQNCVSQYYFNKRTDFDIFYYKLSGGGECCMPAALLFKTSNVFKTFSFKSICLTLFKYLG